MLLSRVTHQEAEGTVGICIEPTTPPNSRDQVKAVDVFEETFPRVFVVTKIFQGKLVSTKRGIVSQTVIFPQS